MTAHNTGDIKTRVVGVLCDNGVKEDSLKKFKNKLEAEGATVKIVAPKGGKIKTDKGTAIKVDDNFLTVTSVAYEAIFVPDGCSEVLAKHEVPRHVMNEAFKHCKAIAVDGSGKNLLDNTDIPQDKPDKALLVSKSPEDFVKAIAAGRNWDRELSPVVPA